MENPGCADDNSVCIDMSQDGVRRLIEQLSSRPGVVPFVGAGLSVPYGLPTWRAFLLKLAAYWGEAASVRDLLDEGRYEEAAEHLSNRIPLLALGDALENAFGDHAVVDAARRTAAALLPRLAAGPVITTNFDHVLERVFDEAGAPFDRIIWGARADSVVRALQADRRILVKVHGDVEDTTDRVLTRGEYDARYGVLDDEGGAAKPLPRLLRRVLESRTVLFIGCSLKDDRIVSVLNAAAGRNEAFTHYAIVPEPPSVEARRERERFLYKRRIRPIWYPEGRHDLIEPFLGELLSRLGTPVADTLAPLVSADEFFRPLLRPAPGRLLRHDWSLVGRDDILEGLHRWVRDPDLPVGILAGRGGVGKSKVLHAFSQGFSDRYEGVGLLFALPGVPFAAEALPVPTTPVVVVVDDAHHREDLSVLLDHAQRYRAHVQLLLTTRPHRLAAIRSALSRARFDVREVASLGHLGNLTAGEARALASQALGDRGQDLAGRLAQLARDSALVIVVGAQLLAERSVSPHLLERDDEFRQVLLDRFQDELTGRVSDTVDPSHLRRVLELVAALAPIRPESEQFLRASAEFLELPVGEVVRVIDALEAGGLLLRRGGTLRITPDVLADHVLHRACFGARGTPTGFALEVFQGFRSLYLTQVLANLAELDWRIRVTGGGSTVLLDGIWRSLDDELRQGSHRERHLLLSQLREVAFLQPDQVLQMVEYAMHNPASHQPDEQEAPWYADTHARVLELLPRLLRGVGHNPEYLPRVCDLLWELGRDDPGPLNPNPNHAMRVLVDFAGYDLDKPLPVNGAVLRAVERWLGQPKVHTHRHSPLDVLDPLLAKTAASHRTEGFLWVASPFSVSKETTGPLRRRVLELLLGCLESGDLKVVLRVLESIFIALQEPHPLFNQTIALDEIESWLPERREALEAIGRISREATSPLVHLRVAERLGWYVEFRRRDAIGRAAAEILAAIPRTPELRLLAVLSGRFELWPPPEDAGDLKRLGRRHRWAEGAIEVFGADVVATHPDPAVGAQAIEDGMRLLADHGITPVPMQLLRILAGNDAGYGAGIAEFALGNPGTVLARYLGTILWELRAADRERAVSLAERAVDHGDVSLAYSVSSWARVSEEDAGERDLVVIRRLVAHPDLHVRRAAVEALSGLGRFQPHVAAELAIGAEVGHDAGLAAAVCGVFDPEFGVDPVLLEDDDVAGLLDKLRAADTVDDYHVGRFLAHAASRLPRQVTAMLLARIDEAPRARTEFEPLPFDGLGAVFAGAADHPEYGDTLRDVRDRAVADDWRTEFWLPRLFRAASGGLSSAGVALVEEWATSNDPDRVRAAARLLSGAPRSFVFDHRDLVARLLEHAHRLGGDTFVEVCAHLGKSAWAGERSRTPGVDEAYPQDLELRLRSTEALVALPSGSPAHRFYADLLALAEDNIRREQLRDEEELG